MAAVRSGDRYSRKKCRAAIEDLTAERAAKRCAFGWVDVTEASLILYNMRHVQHGAAQLNLILRQKTDSAPSWVKKSS